MADPTHEWVKNFEEHEGVFVCTNVLTTDWAQQQIIRAFGTYQFIHTSDPDSLNFRHETGVMIAYDGSVVAITYADDNAILSEALSDLFNVLHGLGWHQVDAFHPMTTMEEFMADVGHSIPAALHDFDVRPATLGSPIGDVSEGAELVRNAQRLFGMPTEDAVNVLRSTFLSLDEGVFDDEVLVAPGLLSGQAEADEQAIYMPHLIGAHESQFQEVEFIAPRFEVATQSPQSQMQAQGFNDVGDEPQTTLEPAQEIDQTQHDDHALKPTVLPIVHELNKNMEDRMTALPEVNAEAGDEGDLQGRSTKVLTVVEIAAPDIQVAPTMIKIGHSVIYFDRPGERMDEAAIGTSMGEMGLHDVVVTHLFPGAVNGAVRWDFLGEIGDNPWFAEVLAALMVPKADCAFAAALLQVLRKRNAMSGLRDLVSVANYSDSRMEELFAAVSSGVHELYVYARKRGRVSAVMDVLVTRVGCLALVPVAGAFVDLVNTEGASEMGIPMPGTFTMREIASSGESRAYVVHVSELDSPFVVWLADVLGHIAMIYSSVKPVAKSVVVVDDDVQVDPTKAAVNEQVSKVLGPLFAQLKAAGIDVNSLVG
jgi:hypothetical protein